MWEEVVTPKRLRLGRGEIELLGDCWAMVLALGVG